MDSKFINILNLIHKERIENENIEIPFFPPIRLAEIEMNGNGA